ncbi:MAG: hypothetical protein H6922_01430 [Pseudomonadaceae bacterium]|nr:hypothetical protein [Pseudomonadaceae bacterium]
MDIGVWLRDRVEGVKVGWLRANRAWMRDFGAFDAARNVLASRVDIFEVHKMGRGFTGLDALEARLVYARAWGRANALCACKGAGMVEKHAPDAWPYIGMPRERDLTDEGVRRALRLVAADMQSGGGGRS